MSEEVKKKGLGRGLSALLGGSAEEISENAAEAAQRHGGGGGPKPLPIASVRPGRFQPRRRFDDERIADLVESIREKGVLQPILVRRHPTEADAYEIIAGERRWRAAQQVPLHEIPAILRDFTDREALEVALVENLQRQDLSPLEEAEGYRRLMEEFNHTQEELSKVLGKSRSHLANTLRLLTLPEPLRDLLDKGELSAGHARALLSAADPIALASEVVAKGLNVRDTEKLAQSSEARKPRRKDPPTAKDPDTAALERDLTNLLGVRVELRSQGKGGELVLHYGNLEQLDGILHRLSRQG